jgi:NAD(P)-dependent dehydrogenase (short-subunit alcohol dehydrogenase family)
MGVPSTAAAARQMSRARNGAGELRRTSVIAPRTVERLAAVSARCYEQILVRIPAGRWGEPPDIAGALVFLASPSSDYVHGIVLPVDGGWLGR